MVTRSAADETISACLLRLEVHLDNRSAPLDDLAALPPKVLAAALKRLAHKRPDEIFQLCESLLESGHPNLLIPTIEGLGAILHERALDLLTPFVSSTDCDHRVRSAARRSLYRLSQAGIRLKSTATPPRPFLARAEERLVRTWTSGIDGAGSRGLWVHVEDSHGGLSLVTLVVNDQVGILECAGGAISKKQLAPQLQEIKTNQKLSWVEYPPELAIMAVREALATHDAAGTAPPDSFTRWRPLFAQAQIVKREAVKNEVKNEVQNEVQNEDPTLLDHSAELLEIPELAGWFIDPGEVQSEGIELLQARESRLVVNEQIKAEREAAIVDRVIERTFTDPVRQVWAKRLRVMAWLFNETGRERQGAIAAATADALSDPAKSLRHIPFVRSLAQRGLDLATEVALGRVKREHVSRSPLRK